MQVKVQVEGYGNFQIDNAKINELLNWLSANQGVKITEQNKVREVQDNQYTGRELLNG